MERESPNSSGNSSQEAEKIDLSEDTFERITVLVQTEINKLIPGLNEIKEDIREQRNIRVQWLSLQSTLILTIVGIVLTVIINTFDIFLGFNDRLDSYRNQSLPEQCNQSQESRQTEIKPKTNETTRIQSQSKTS